QDISRQHLFCLQYPLMGFADKNQNGWACNILLCASCNSPLLFWASRSHISLPMGPCLLLYCSISGFILFLMGSCIYFSRFLSGPGLTPFQWEMPLVRNATEITIRRGPGR